MGLFDVFKKKSTETDYESPVHNTKNYEIDDMSYIAEMKHFSKGPWHQYDVLLAARGYGWNDILNWADYMAQADIDHISNVTKVAIIGAEPVNILDDYLKFHKFSKIPALQEESGVLTVGGMSKTVGGPVQIVWFNQSQLLRFFTISDDETLMKRYAETVIRRTFNTPDAMKLARPVTNGEE